MRSLYLRPAKIEISEMNDHKQIAAALQLLSFATASVFEKEALVESSHRYVEDWLVKNRLTP